MRLATCLRIGLFTILVGCVVTVEVSFAKDHFKRYVLIYGTGCNHFVTEQKFTLHKQGGGDDVTWLFSNTCGTDKEVLVCVYYNNELENPFQPCTGGVEVATVFSVPGTDGEQRMTCTPKAGATEADYKKQILVGTKEIPANKQCPAKPKVFKATEGVRTHILDFDVQP